MIGKGLWKRTHKLKIQSRSGANYELTGDVINNIINDYQFGRSPVNIYFYNVTIAQLEQSTTSDGVVLSAPPAGYEKWLNIKKIAENPPISSGPNAISFVIGAMVIYLNRTAIVLDGLGNIVSATFTTEIQYDGALLHVEAVLAANNGSYICTVKSKVLNTLN